MPTLAVQTGYAIGVLAMVFLALTGLWRFLAHWLPTVEALPGPPGLRWSIDVDPLEVD